ncbi:MAG: hypothetical protein IPP74_00175 [Alphaproteobacteria bacterium]|nr:hypothetical protein [Alphaproteobacteria bacterium]
MLQSISLFVKNFSIGSARAAVLPALPIDRGPFAPSDIAMGEDWKFVSEALTSVIPQEAHSHRAAVQDKESQPEDEGNQDVEDESDHDADALPRDNDSQDS